MNYRMHPLISDLRKSVVIVLLGSERCEARRAYVGIKTMPSETA